jgi:mycothiol synthase
MSVQPRPYTGLHDLDHMKHVIIEGRKISPHSGYPHIGDLDWWLFYGAWVRGRSPGEIITLWEDDQQQVIGWTYVEDCGFELALLPEYRGGADEATITAWAEHQLTALARSENKPVSAYACADDSRRCALLESRGYSGSDFLVYFSQALDSPLPEPTLPDGFTFLETMREEYAPQRADVHFNAFHPSRMTAEAYHHFMQAPNYDPALDIVVAAADGQFAAFAMGWIDPINRLSVFEPVGTRDTMQRRGLGRAALLEGLRRLQARGVDTATVCTHATNAGNIAFYQSAGFRLTNTIRMYKKPVREQA